ncbi:MAG: tetratricopeptide (TPR) repeat protein [Cognaticolwellia sp.]
MADDDKRTLPGEEEEVDYLFQARMSLFKWFTRNWKGFAAIAGAVLVVALVYNVYDSVTTNRAKEGAAAIHAVDSKMPKIEPMARMGILPIDDLNDATRLANLEEGARRYEAAAMGTGGSAASEAWLKAAGTHERLGHAEQAKAAYEQAMSAYDKGILGFGARTALAGMALEAGDTAGALGHYATLAEREDGLLAEQAMIYQASVYEDMDDQAQLQATYDSFLERFPSSPRTAEFDRYGLVADVPAVPAPTEG